MKLKFMHKALELAKNADGDIPVGAVIVKGEEVISCAVNEREKSQKVISHAEILAIQRANEKLNSWRLNDCEMYVTLEPCPMCAGAIVQARLKVVYFGAYDMIMGAMGSKIDMKELLKSRIDIKGGIMEEECSSLLKDYFKGIRNDRCN